MADVAGRQADAGAQVPTLGLTAWLLVAAASYGGVALSSSRGL